MQGRAGDVAAALLQRYGSVKWCGHGVAAWGGSMGAAWWGREGGVSAGCCCVLAAWEQSDSE